MNRRDLILLGAATAWPMRHAFAAIPPPPSSPWYLAFIADGIYQITDLLYITLPPEVGTCRTYTQFNVAYAVAQTFNFTGRSGVGAWRQLLNAPSYRWWEVVDMRNGHLYRLWEGDKLEVKFSDGSRVKVQFNRPGATYLFKVLVGTERLPDGTRLYPRERGTFGGAGKTREESGTVVQIRPRLTTVMWSYSTQETPW